MKLSIIIPTYNLPEYFNPCVQSIIDTGILKKDAELVVINNGSQPIADQMKDIENVRVITPGKNLGWEGGLKWGLAESDSEFVCFQNDDTYIPKACESFYEQLLWPLQHPEVSAVGPATTTAAGWHSVYMRPPLKILSEVSYLIFFTAMLRRKDMEEVGGIDDTAPGGDDIDLSIRLRKAGKHLLVNPHAFLIHHAFKTGTRVRGEAEVAGGWNSREMQEATNKWIIQKHGFRTYLQTVRGMAPL